MTRDFRQCDILTSVDSNEPVQPPFKLSVNSILFKYEYIMIQIIYKHKTLHLKKKTFCGFSMGRNQFWVGRVYELCVYYMTGTPEGSTESGFMEKPGIEPATPGLQGIALIHYTTGASKTLHLKGMQK